MIDRSVLKANARMRMAESEPRYWKVMLVWFLAAVLAPTLLQNVSVNPVDRFYTLVASGIDPYIAAGVFAGGAAMVGLFLGIVLALYQFVMSFGATNYALKLYRGEECGQGSLFEGFSMVGRAVGAQLLVALFIFLWALLLAVPLAIVVVLFSMVFQGGFGVFLAVAAYIGYIVAVIAIALKYSLTTLALADQPELGALGAIQRSKDLMRGYKGAYFVLCLSFLGWILLCGLIEIVLLGLQQWGFLNGGMAWLLNLPTIVRALLVTLAGLPVYLWLNPYMELTLAGFYDTLCPKEPPQHEPLNDYPAF